MPLSYTHMIDLKEHNQKWEKISQNVYIIPLDQVK